ncbi:MAG: bifunctional phosphoribosylaminoimidazolecarboxamide formyltransferase/inosine monophosphate cyclohydrolase [Coriobacteriales bacterium]|nr:bifunctional phosphoribosylaminoimidazolecarboxamide formyltransferase/inosine monophosphate cyclohydrolase [Coriobacteriales bacterium]
MNDPSPKIQRVLISVTDKTGIIPFARALAEEFGAEIISTGGTARVLAAEGIPVRPIDELTGFPEMMDGRLKTLHPRVHGALLARRDLPEHLEQARQHDIALIDMVVVNLYAFEFAAASGAPYGEVIENIDIGGPAMLRSAAKNHAALAVVTDPDSYDEILAEMRDHDGAITLATRQRLALQVFRLTSAYDNAIFNWLEQELNGRDPLSGERRLFLQKQADLRYGENPHQRAAFYLNSTTNPSANSTTNPASNSSASRGLAPAANPSAGSQTGIQEAWQLARARQLQGKELSYNNYLDLDAAWTAVREFAEPAAVIVKHLTPCGIACNDSLTQAYQRAWASDPTSAFGGVMAFNRELPAELVQAIAKNGQFVEAIVAPGFAPAALELLKDKPNLRVLETGGVNPAGGVLEYRSVEGGVLVQTADAVVEDPALFSVPSVAQPTPEQIDELLFAWKAAKSVKSNAIVISKGRATIGIGAGQPNRVNAAELAVRQAGPVAEGAVAASDAFMPFADSLEVLAAAGVRAVIQPGGSVRDAEVIAAADAAGIALVFSGQRHFRH